MLVYTAASHQGASPNSGFGIQMSPSSPDPRPLQTWTGTGELLCPVIATAGYEFRHIPAKLKRSTLGIPEKLSTSLMEQ